MEGSFEPSPPSPESPPAPPPSTPVEFSLAFDAGPRLRDAWTGMKAAWLPLWLGGLLMLIFDCNGSRGLSGNDDRSPSTQAAPVEAPAEAVASEEADEPDARPWLLGWNQPANPFDNLLGNGMGLGFTIGLLVFALVIVVVFFVLRSFLRTGWIRLHDHVLRTGTQAFAPLFSGADRLADMMLHRLLGGLIEGIALLPALGGFALSVYAAGQESVTLVLVGFAIGLAGLVVVAYVWLGTSLGPWALVLDQLGPVDALAKSWSLARGNRLSLFLYFFLNGLFALVAALLGLVALCIGLIATLPTAQAMMDLSRTQAYLLATRGDEVRAYWRLFDPSIGVGAIPPGTLRPTF